MREREPRGGAESTDAVKFECAGEVFKALHLTDAQTFRSAVRNHEELTRQLGALYELGRHIGVWGTGSDQVKPPDIAALGARARFPAEDYGTLLRDPEHMVMLAKKSGRIKPTDIPELPAAGEPLDGRTRQALERLDKLLHSERFTEGVAYALQVTGIHALPEGRSVQEQRRWAAAALSRLINTESGHEQRIANIEDSRVMPKIEGVLLRGTLDHAARAERLRSDEWQVKASVRVLDDAEKLGHMSHAERLEFEERLQGTASWQVAWNEVAKVSGMNELLSGRQTFEQTLIEDAGKFDISSCSAAGSLPKKKGR